MEPSEIINTIVSFAQNNTVIAIIVGLGLLYFVYRKPKLFFMLLIIGLFLYGLFYMITSVAGPGSAEKRKLIQQEEKQPD